MSIKELCVLQWHQFGDASYVGQRKAARSDAPRKHQKAGEEEGMGTEAADLALQVQAKLTVQLESRMRDIETTMYWRARS